MKRILELVYSTKATLWLLLAFALSMAIATFVEDRYDTVYAQKIIYRTWWFEAILLLLAINFIGNIQRYNLLSSKKISGLVFHLAFILMILGAGVTRYFGFEGLLHIREGEANDVLLTTEKVVKVVVVDGSGDVRESIPFETDSLKQEPFKTTISTKGGDLTLSFKSFLPKAQYTLVENQPGGVDGIRVNVLDKERESDVFIADQEITGAFSKLLAFNNTTDTAALVFSQDKDGYYVTAPVPMVAFSMLQMSGNKHLAGTRLKMEPMVQYSTEDGSFKFIFNGGFHKAVPKLVPATTQGASFSAILLDANYQGKNSEVSVVLNESGFAELKRAEIEGVTLLLGYGEKEIKLPFSVALRDFVLERYPGSSAPSSYASEVTLMDTRKNVKEDYRIYMNHVLDYDGYRFFQSSYDRDEHGTVLSVNHDFWGTWITYLGYILLGVGFFWNLFSPSSRFQILGRSIREIRKLRTGATMLLFAFLVSAGGINAQDVVRTPVSPAHAEVFGKLIVQTIDGRSEPAHTLAYDVLHKISRKDHFSFSGKGEMDAMQLLMDVIIDPMYWRNQKLIYVREKAVQEKLGITDKYASFMELVDSSQHFRLAAESEEAFRKKPAEQNNFDKEVMKVSERFEIFMMMMQGSLLRIFPEPTPGSTIWVSWDQPQAQMPVNDGSNMAQALGLPAFTYNNLMGAYLNAVYTGAEKGDYARADKIAEMIKSIQRSSAVGPYLPSEKQVDYEIIYNKANVFVFLRNVYSVLAILLLVLAFMENFMEKKNRVVSLLLNGSLVLLGLAFAYHTFGMGMRWYLSGHAPWSNGYEALLLVGWASILAGFSFLKYSRIPIAATTLLAFFTLMTAGHSSYDPQITNLQPVLKSYWLIIHVATLTISYGFLGMAFFLGLLILMFYMLRNAQNGQRITLLIKELSHINEMNITIGLMLATVGTFLGGVWANESWGRYWGWDAKETWALIIVITYSIVIHFRLVEQMRGDFLFTAGSVLGFSSVLMTFIGVNYYLSKGMHSYGQGDTPIFPIWAWIAIFAIFALIFVAGRKDRAYRNLQNK